MFTSVETKLRTSILIQNLYFICWNNQSNNLSLTITQSNICCEMKEICCTLSGQTSTRRLCWRGPKDHCTQTLAVPYTIRIQGKLHFSFHPSKFAVREQFIVFKAGIPVRHKVNLTHAFHTGFVIIRSSGYTC